MPEPDLAFLPRPPDGAGPTEGASYRRWAVERAAALAAIEACPALSCDVRRAWHAALAGVGLTDDGEAALTALLDLARARAVGAALTGTPDAWRNLSALVAGLSRIRETHARARAPL